MKYLRTILIAALLLAGLAGCGGGPTSGIATPTNSPPTAGVAQPTTPPEPTSAPTAQPAQPTAAPRATAGAEPAEAGNTPIVIFRKTGGIMGMDETLTVNADGTLALRGRNGTAKTAKVSAERLAKLRELLSSSDYAKLQTEYKVMGADMFIYDITVPGGTPAHVQTMDGVENPPVLDQIIQELSELRKQV